MKRKFTQEEDNTITKLVDEYGIHHWNEIASKLPGRTARQCRERWKHYLSQQCPSPWTPQEDKILEEKYREYGPKWTTIKNFLPHKTSVSIKNRYSLLLRKKKKEASRIKAVPQIPHPAQLRPQPVPIGVIYGIPAISQTIQMPHILVSGTPPQVIPTAVPQGPVQQYYVLKPIIPNENAFVPPRN